MNCTNCTKTENRHILSVPTREEITYQLTVVFIIIEMGKNKKQRLWIYMVVMTHTLKQSSDCRPFSHHSRFISEGHDVVKIFLYWNNQRRRRIYV